MTQHGMVGADVYVPLDASYRRCRDIAPLLRGLGEARQAISVIKKRTGKHERTIREMRLDKKGLPLANPYGTFKAC
jgi:circadian clock protein KaiC